MPKPTIVAIDDEPNILGILKDFLGEEYNIITASSSPEGLALVFSKKPDLVLIDNIMPDMSGLDVVRLLRQAESTLHIPVIMLTALMGVHDRINAFNSGVDDFISKPFSLDELKVRIDSKLRRFENKTIKQKTPTVFGNVSLYPASNDVTVNETRVHLTQLEYNILELLLTEADHVVSRQKIISQLWKDSQTDDRILDIHMATLRKKLSHFDHKIETVYGQGYIIRKKMAA
ncbi:MAG: response regulator transcription factor [Bacillota bacterium]